MSAQVTRVDSATPRASQSEKPSSEILEKLNLIPEEDWLKVANITKGTADMWQRRRKGPPRILIGNNYYYPLVGALQYIEEKLEDQ